MGFGKPSVPGIKMPPPAAHPATLGSTSVALAGHNAKVAAEAAEGLGVGGTVKTSTQGDLTPAPTAKNTLLGQ